MFHGYVLLTTRIDGPDLGRPCRAAALAPGSDTFIKDELNSPVWISQTEAEGHAERLARRRAAAKGFEIPTSDKPEWKAAPNGAKS